MKNDSPNDAKGWAIVWDFLRTKPLFDASVTTVYFFLHPLKFTDEVVQGDWSMKAKPPWFLVETFILACVLRLVTPWQIIDEAPSTYTSAQKQFYEATDLTSSVIAFFAASFIIHSILGRSRIPFVSAFFVFCYINGTTLFASHLIVALSWLVTGSQPSSIFLLWSGIIEITLALAFLYYFLAPVIHLYHPRWYLIVIACFCGFITFGAIGVSLSYLSDMIISCFPSQ